MIRKFAFALSVTTICANANPEYALSKSPTLDNEFERGITVKRKAIVEKDRGTINNKKKSKIEKRALKQKAKAAIRKIKQQMKAEILLEIKNNRTNKPKTRAEKQAEIKKIRKIKQQTKVKIRKITIARKKGQTFADLLKRPSLQGRTKSPQNTVVILPSIKKIISKPSNAIPLPQKITAEKIFESKPAVKAVPLPIAESKTTPVANVPKPLKTSQDIKQDRGSKTKPVETRTVVIDAAPAPALKNLEDVNAALRVPPVKNAQIPFVATVKAKEEEKRLSSPQTLSKISEKKNKVPKKPKLNDSTPKQSLPSLRKAITENISALVPTLLPRDRSVQKNKPLKMQAVRIAPVHETPIQIKKIPVLRLVELAGESINKPNPSEKKVQIINMREKKKDTSKKESIMMNFSPIKPKNIKIIEESSKTVITPTTQETAAPVIIQNSSSENSKQTAIVKDVHVDIDIKTEQNDKRKKNSYSAPELPSITKEKKEIYQSVTTSPISQSQPALPQIKPAEVPTNHPNTSDRQTVYMSGKLLNIGIKEKQKDKSYFVGFRLPSITEGKIEASQLLPSSSSSQTQSMQQPALPAVVTTSQPQPAESTVQTIHVSGKRLDIDQNNPLSASMPVMPKDAHVYTQTIWRNGESMTVKRKSSGRKNNRVSEALTHSLPVMSTKIPETPKELASQMDDLLAMGNAIGAPEFIKHRRILTASAAYLRSELEGNKTPEHKQRREKLFDELNKKDLPEPPQAAAHDNTIRELTKLKRVLHKYPEKESANTTPSNLTAMVGLVGAWGAKIIEIFSAKKS